MNYFYLLFYEFVMFYDFIATTCMIEACFPMIKITFFNVLQTDNIAQQIHSCSAPPNEKTFLRL